MCGFLLPMQGKAFQTPVPPYGPSDQTFNYFGPAANELIMKFYSSDTAEFSALQNGTIDFMDSILTPSQYSSISSNPAVTTGFVASTELVEYDINNYVAPFSNLNYRQAFAAAVNRTAYLDTYFAGGGTPCYDPLDFNPFGQAAEAYCESIYGAQGNFADVYSLFVQSAYPVYYENGTNGVPNLGSNANPDGGGYFTWYFASPYPSSGPSPAQPVNTSGPYNLAIPNATIQIFARTEHPERLDQAAYIIGLLGYSVSVGGPFSGDKFTTWCEQQYALYGNSYFASLGMALPIVNGKPYFPVINFLETDITQEVADVIVMSYYRFQMYTGAWILDEFQDGLKIWLSPNTPILNNWEPFCLNYDSWQDTTTNYNGTGEPEYDYFVYASLSASYPGYGFPNDPTGSLYWAIRAMDDMMPQVPIIPMFYYSGYSAVLTQDNYTVNAIGTGFDNWFTYMDAVSPSGTLTWGWSADLENPNPVSSTLAWDWYILTPIYDSMLYADPYTNAIIPALATNYSVTISDPANPYYALDTSALMTLRADSFWQDLPAMNRTAYTLDGGSELNGPITDQQVTPADVAFTYEYLVQDGLFQPVHLYSTVYDVGQIVISSMYKSLFAAYNTTYNNVWNGFQYVNGVVGYTWENLTYIDSPSMANGAIPVSGLGSAQDFIRFSNTLGPSQVKVYFTDQTGWFCEYAELGIPILPMYIFSHLAEASWPDSAVSPGFVTPSEFTMVLDPSGANLLFGSGPYIWTGYTTGIYTLVAFKSGISYEGVTEDAGYWAEPVRVADVMSLGHQPINYYYQPETNTLHLQYTLTNWENATVSDTLTVSVTPYYYVSGSWVEGTMVTGTADPLAIVAGATIAGNWTAFALGAVPAGATWLTFAISSSMMENGVTVEGTYGFAANQWSPYDGTSGIAMINLADLPGDVNGGTAAAPYYGCQGLVNLRSLSLITGNWQAHVSWTGSFNPTDTLHRADINAQGKINLVSLSFITGEWLHTWNLNTAKPPTTPPPYP